MTRPVLKQSVVGVFIANEENGTFKGVGVDQLSLEGYLDDLKKGPVYWIDPLTLSLAREHVA